MKKTTISSNPQRIFIITISTVLVFLIALFIYGLGAGIAGRISAYDRDNLQFKNDIAKLQFCIDKKISPCSKESLQKWNDEHEESWQKYSPVKWED